MTVEYRTGDLFAQPDLQAIGHGVNCRGKMGAGIAVLFARKFPDMLEAYQSHCEDGTLQLGKVFPWHDKDSDLWVFNMASQYNPGANAELEALKETVKKVVSFCEARDIESVGLPQIGCGIGGLNWPEVSSAIEAIAGPSAVTVVLVSFE